MSRILAFPLLVAVLAATVAFYFGIQQTQAADTTVEVTDFAFTPSNISINAADTVTFNVSEGTHSVVFTGGPAATGSGELGVGDTFAFTPTEEGTYTYECGIHGSLMTGVIDVAAQQAETETPTTETETPTTTAETETPSATNTATPSPTTTTATATATNTRQATSTPTRTATTAPTTANTATSTAVAATPIAPDTGAGTGGSGGGFPWSVLALGTIAALAVAGGGFAAATMRGRE